VAHTGGVVVVVVGVGVGGFKPGGSIHCDAGPCGSSPHNKDVKGVLLGARCQVAELLSAGGGLRIGLKEQ